MIEYHWPVQCIDGRAHVTLNTFLYFYINLSFFRPHFFRVSKWGIPDFQNMYNV